MKRIVLLFGSIWLLMHSQGNFFLLLSLFLFCNKRQYFWAGLSFAIAFQVRYLILVNSISNINKTCLVTPHKIDVIL
jgi:hypothetical protein